MKHCTLVIMAAVIGSLLLPLHAYSQAADSQRSAPNPLEPFGKLVGGQWQLDGSYQEFEWGLGRRSVKARSYFVVEGEPRLVSEGIWFWHPGEEQIKGVFTAIDMPVVFFDYTTRFESNTMINDLRAYGVNGTETRYLETWDFIDDEHYVWALAKKTPEGLKEQMSGTYSRDAGFIASEPSRH